MKLLSFQVSTFMGPQTRIGALTPDGKIIDLATAHRLRLRHRGLTDQAAARIADALLPGNMVDWIEGGKRSREAAEEAIEWAVRRGRTRDLYDAHVVFELGEVVMLAPIPRPPLLRDFMGFETHLRNIYPKLGREIPQEWYSMPVYYKGNVGSVGTHNEEISIPSYANELDFEFELAAILGKGGMNIPREEALQHVVGYTIYNDFSARAIQSREMSVGLGPAKGKDFARAHVLGPWLVTADEIPDIYNMRLVARVNGEVWCESNTNTMHWKFEDMIAHASMDERLYPGEVFGSGTVGNGSGMERGTFLRSGDVVELEVDALGTLRNRVI